MFSQAKLKSIREKSGYTQSAVAKALGVTRSAYSSWESGKYIPNSKNLDELARFFKVDKREFESNLEIVGKYLRLNESNKKELLSVANRLYMSELVSYKVHARLSAGVGSFYDDEYEYDTAFFNKQIRHDVASWIQGDSMEPKYKNGDVALIVSSGFEGNGIVHALVLNEKTYIKKVYVEGQSVRLVSLNKEYTDIFANLEDVRIVGKVVSSFSPIEV